MVTTIQPTTTPYEYVGDVPALGSLQLTRLAKSFEEIDSQGLEDLFPTVQSEERTVVIETMREGLGIMPIVQMGVPAGNFLEPERVERRYVQPVFLREDDFVDQALINQLRKVGTLNEKDPPLQIIQRRVQRLVNRHNRTRNLLQAMCLQGGINYTDPRTKATINVSTQIPTHNYFRYDGWDATLASGAAIGTTGYVAAKNLTNNKGRKEALLFTDKSGRAGVPWSHPQADLVRCLRFLRQYCYNSNKVLLTDMVMSRDLYTVIQENEIIQAQMGSVGVITVPGGTNGAVNEIAAASSRVTPPSIRFDSAGDVQSIAGLNIRLIDSMYRDPVDNVIKKMWPSNLVAVIARSHHQDRSASLGQTMEPVGESPDGTAGLWMRTGPDQMPPAVPGRAMQLGNCFLPYVTYPQWIMLLTVADTGMIDETLILRSDLEYGTF
ncbi:hypothetical protein OsccyDRAFT_0679 [Leptolyngbyaceae cyanobacterium JSC-12]|nr:hypothetical protein OsccyDRAFT_0679 [Leptolyngbyaceae cyanobacterium JSC-12]